MSGEGSAALWEAFRARTGSLGAQPAVVGPGGDLSFSDLWSQADALASTLRDAGVAESGAVGLAVPNTTRFPVALLALWRLDAAVVLIPPQYRAAELGSVVDGVGLSAVVTQDAQASAIAQAMGGADGVLCDGLAAVIAARRGTATVEPGAALMKLSSGSTAQPKCIVLDARHVLAEAENVTATLELAARDRVVAGVPLFHSYGFDLGVLPMLHVGVSLEIEGVFVPRRTLVMLAEGRPSAYLGVPAEYRAMLTARLDEAPELTGVRWLLSCTAPLAADVVTVFAERFGAPICQHYGSSETGAATNHVPTEVLRLPGSVGRAMDGVRVQVVDREGRPLPAGTEGDVMVSSDAVARGYVLGAPDGPSPFRRDGFATGDIGRLDEDGFLTLLGRRDAVINVGGFKVSPEEVVAALERHPAVRDAAVVGVPAEAGDHAVVAAVTLSDLVDEAELVSFCGEELAEYKVPRRIVVMDELPRTAAGKVRLRPEDL
jgi:long-chain acyl-CoA synthetase